MNRKKGIILITILAFFIFIIDYNFLNSSLEEFFYEKEEIRIERVIDGDTVVAGDSIRLLGINTPEKGEKYFNEAKEFLESLVLNKTTFIEYGKERKDLYGRILGYIYSDRNINVELVRNGFANVYIYDIDRHTEELRKAWEECISKGNNLCKKSENKCADCILLKGIENQKVTFENKCSFSCNITKWEIKDEGRKKFYFPEFILDGEVSVIVGNGADGKNVLYWKGEDYVWTEEGDTLFLRDAEGRLVLWEEMGR
jgi:micrococcal nuclease